jgi:hypothetical protein
VTETKDIYCTGANLNRFHPGRQPNSPKSDIIFFTKNSQLNDVTTCISVVTCMSDCRRGMDWMLDLLTTYRS